MLGKILFWTLGVLNVAVLAGVALGVNPEALPAPWKPDAGEQAATAAAIVVAECVESIHALPAQGASVDCGHGAQAVLHGAKVVCRCGPEWVLTSPKRGWWEEVVGSDEGEEEEEAPAPEPEPESTPDVAATSDNGGWWDRATAWWHS